MHQWFGPGPAMRLAFAGRFTARWSRWAEIRVHHHGPAGLLPDSADALTWVRVALALREQATRDPELAALVRTYRTLEGEALARHLGTPPDVTLLVQALLDGVRLQVVVSADGEEGGFAAGRELLHRALSRLLDVKQAVDGTPLTAMTDGDDA